MYEFLINSEFFDHLDTPIFIKNVSGVYVYCNDAFTNLTGFSKKNTLGSTAFDIAPVRLAELYMRADKDLFNSQDHQRYVAPVQKNGGEDESLVTFSKSIIYRHEHGVAGFIGSIAPKEKGVKESGLKKLTKREIEVLTILAKGKSVKSIATLLGISTHTASDHLKSIYIKLDSHSKSEAIYKAMAMLNIKP